MANQRLDVRGWVSMFEAVGLDEPGRHKWHGLFEQRFPQDHQSFLEGLGLDGKQIDEIRELARTAWRS